MTPEDLRTFALLLRSGQPARRAARLLAEHGGTENETLLRAARLIALGTAPATAFGEGETLGRVLAIQEETGGDLAAMVDELAEALERSERAERAARSHAAGVQLSARMVALLPLLFAPALRPQWDGPGVALLAAGVGLAAAGIRWIRRLLPGGPPPLPPVEELAVVTSAALAGGCSLRTVLGAAARRPGPLTDELRRAERRVRLGLSWPQALARSGEDGLVRMGRAIELGDTLGMPQAETLAAFRRAQAAEAERVFDEELRMAPVRMVVPLTVCVLPAFILLGAAPFVRSVLGL